MTLRVEDSDGDWEALRSSVDAARFDRGAIGPYKIGASIRSTAFGEVAMAIHDALERVVELDIYDALAGSPAAGPEGTLMPDLAQAATIEHPHVLQVIGAGIEAGVPYAVRPLLLGRTLDQVLKRGGKPDLGAAASIVFAVAEGLSALAEHGPQPGACAMGGFDARDVFLTFDGDVKLTGIGLKAARSPDADPLARDLESVRLLVEDLGLERALLEEPRPAELARSIRRAHRDALGRRRARVAAELRHRFDSAIHEERAFFGLTPIQ